MDEEQRANREEEEEMMKAGAKDGVGRQQIGGHTPVFSSSSFTCFTSSPFQDESCSSELFGTAHLDTANQIIRTEDAGKEKEEEEGMKEENEKEEKSSSDEEEEEDNEEVRSPLLHLQIQVRPHISTHDLSAPGKVGTFLAPPGGSTRLPGVLASVWYSGKPSLFGSVASVHGREASYLSRGKHLHPTVS